MLRFRSLLIVFTLSGFSAPSVFSQAVPAGPAQFTLKARTTVEDVVVLDKNGRAVPGLRKEDFQVFENGRPQAITFFESNFAATEPAATSPEALPHDTFTNIPVTPANNVTNVLLLDALNSRSTERMYAQVRMVKYLASLPPNLRIGVFTLDKEKFHMLWGLTQESSELRSVIAQFAAKHRNTAAASSAVEHQELTETADALKKAAEDTNDPRLGESAHALQSFLRHGAGTADGYGDFFITMNALEALAHYLAGIPGRKNLFWLASSFPHQFKTDSYFAWYRAARDKLTEAGVSVYPIDVNGVDIDTGGVQNLVSISAGSARFEASEGWAEETGGKAYHENDIQQEIADAVDHGSLYYALAYVPSDRKEEGRERKVEVKLVSGDYKIFYRKSYFEQTQKEAAKGGDKPATSPLIDLMGRGMPDISELPYRLKVLLSDPQPGTPRAGENGQLSGKLTRYRVAFQLQVSGLSLLPGADGARHKQLEVMLVVYSQDARPLNWVNRNIDLLIKPEKWASASAEGVSFHIEIDAPPGDVYLRTGVYDSSTSKAGTLEIPLSAITPAQK